MNKEELITLAFDAVHGIASDHLIQTHGECDHDKHGELMVDIIHGLNKLLQS